VSSEAVQLRFSCHLAWLGLLESGALGVKPSCSCKIIILVCLWYTGDVFMYVDTVKCYHDPAVNICITSHSYLVCVNT
jgi:hypothetical protein